MPRKIRIIPAEGAATLEISLRKFTQEDLYGKKIMEKRTAEGEVLSQIFVTLDGSHFLTPKSTSSHYVDENGLYVSSVVPTDQDGHALPIVEDMFKRDLQLAQSISINDFFTFNISKTYVLESKGDLSPLLKRCQLVFLEKKLLTFAYAYYPTAYPEIAILIPVDDNIVVCVGTQASLIWARMNMDLSKVYAPEEEEEEEEPGFGEFW